MRRIDEKTKIKDPIFPIVRLNYGSTISVIGVIASIVLIVNGCSVRPESSMHQIYQVLCIGFGFLMLIASEIASNTRKRDRD